MNRNEAQAHCILTWGLLNPTIVSIGLREASRRPQHDLCELLTRYKRLSSSQADQVRRAVERAIENRQINVEASGAGSPYGSRPSSSGIHSPGAAGAAKSGPRSSKTVNDTTLESDVVNSINEVDDLINTLRMSAPGQGTVQPEKLPGHSSGELGPKEIDRLQDKLQTVRMDKATKELESSADLGSRENSSYMGIQFTRFRILGEIASGAMGVILRAFHLPSRKVVALKILFEDETDETVFARFRREAKVLERLSHPHIVQVIDHGYENNDPYLAMEFILGRHLKELVEKNKSQGTLPKIESLAPIFIKIASALSYCHSMGVVHRDVKPTNILVENASGRPVLVDFGLVKRDAKVLYTSVHASLSNRGEILGTPAYMAPEQLDAKGSHGEINGSTDIWGLGATLFFCITGQTPFAEKTAMSTYVALLSREPRRARDLNKYVPHWLDELCNACMRRKQDQRASLNDFVNCLKTRA